MGLNVLCFGHVGDGNVHANILHDASNEDERRRALTARRRILDLTLSLEGTISGEHGTGISKHEFIGLQLSEDRRRIMAGVKAVFDPKGVMNPGKEPF
jgi:FAD/FMN-containing dehydrogenase